MIGITVAVLSVLLPLLHLHLSKQPRTRSRVIHLLLLYALVLDVGVVGFFSASFRTCSLPIRPLVLSAGRREVRSSSRSDFTMGPGGFSASSVFGLVARSGSRPGSGGHSSCLGPPISTLTRRCTKGTILRTTF